MARPDSQAEADPIQVLADASEQDAAARYEKRRQLASLLADAIRRAEAMARLELTLHYGSVLPKS